MGKSKEKEKRKKRKKKENKPMNEWKQAYEWDTAPGQCLKKEETVFVPVGMYITEFLINIPDLIIKGIMWIKIRNPGKTHFNDFSSKRIKDYGE